MDSSPLLAQIRSAGVPKPADGRMAEHGLARWADTAAELEPQLADQVRALAADPAGKALLETIFGNSPFLAQCCLREPQFLIGLVERGPDANVAEELAALNRDLDRERADLVRQLRKAKRCTALAVALADICGLWDLERVTGALSDFAEAALGAAVRHLLRAAHMAGELVLADPDRPAHGSGFIVLGMGKLGARELNYSSDIDLILLFDAERIRFTGRDSVQQLFARIARDLVGVMAERTAEGYVFRTDLRLRPDPASTPPAVSLRAALTYYESAGQNWERAALIKARPVAGDVEAGAAFLRELTPFLWRRNLDFAAIQDIHSIKRQIDAHRGGARIAVAGHDLKLGRGGIREVEFFAQTQQLIWGGREPELRRPDTAGALAALAAHGRVTSRVAEEMTAAYRFLRRVEHRLQMIDDQQTHMVPADPGGLAHVAQFLGYPETARFAAALRSRLECVERHYAALFEEAPSLAAPGNLVFTGAEDDPETLKTIGRMGFREPPRVAAAVRGWHHGRYRATRSQRAREILTELVPPLLEALAGSADPDGGFLRFDQFLSRLPAGVQLFSLLYANPGLLGLVADIMGAAPRLAGELARRPILLDGVLSQGFFDPPPGLDILDDEAARTLVVARDYQDMLDAARRWTHDRKFQVGVQLLRGTIDAAAAGRAYADIAEAVIGALLPLVEAEFAAAHGRVPGGGLVVLALGKLGGREMTPTSDLDLILVYDAPEDVEQSDGARPLPVPTYYARVCQRLVNALTALTNEGRLYEVDMRLRPSGSAGPTASSFAAFSRYHSELAWTWEHMALTRARPVAGPAALAERVMGVVRGVLTRPRDPDRLVRDVAEMRTKIAAQHARPSSWDVKHRRGGLIDIEFIVQCLQLREAARAPELLNPNTAAAVAALGRAGVLGQEESEALLKALRLWNSVQSLLKLLVEGEFDADAAPNALKATLARGAGAVDFARLDADMSAAATRVQALYAALIDAPAAQARQVQAEEERR